MCPKSRFRKKVPKVVWTHYLLYILTTGTLQKPHFLTPPSNQNAGLFRVVPRMPPRGCKMAPTGPKNGESGVPRDPQGCQRVSQCLLKCSKKTSKISTPAPRVPRVPHRPQNTSIFDVPPTGVTPSRGNVPPSPPTLSYTPLTSSPANMKHPSSATVWAYAHLDNCLPSQVLGNAPVLPCSR